MAEDIGTTMEQGTAPAPQGQPGAPAAIDEEQRRRMIAEAAYFHAEHRGFCAGDALTDWLEAEAEIDAILRGAPEEPEQAPSKRAFEARVEAQLREWDSRIDQLFSMAQRAKASARKEAEHQLGVLSERREGLRERLQEMREASGEAWVDLKLGVDKAWEDMRRAADQIASRFK